MSSILRCWSRAWNRDTASCAVVTSASAATGAGERASRSRSAGLSEARNAMASSRLVSRGPGQQLVVGVVHGHRGDSGADALGDGQHLADPLADLVHGGEGARADTGQHVALGAEHPVLAGHDALLHVPGQRPGVGARQHGHRVAPVEGRVAGRALGQVGQRGEAARLHAGHRQHRGQLHGAHRGAGQLSGRLGRHAGPGVGHDDGPAADAAPEGVAVLGPAHPDVVAAGHGRRHAKQHPADVVDGHGELIVERLAGERPPALPDGDLSQAGHPGLAPVHAVAVALAEHPQSVRRRRGGARAIGARGVPGVRCVPPGLRCHGGSRVCVVKADATSGPGRCRGRRARRAKSVIPAVSP